LLSAGALHQGTRTGSLTSAVEKKNKEKKGLHSAEQVSSLKSNG